MYKTAVFAVVIVALVAGGSLVAYGYYSTNGTIRVYATTGNPDPLYLTVSSIMIHSTSNSSGWITIMNKSDTILLNGNLSFISSATIPTGNYTMIRLVVSAVQITIGGLNVSVKLPSSMLEIPIIKQGLDIRGGQTSDLAVVFGPHIVMTGNGSYILSPVLLAEPINVTS
ncbi:MAG: DUF4382 domain-containing protein [Nitrososphaerota archaeon]|nr:DUF4382 domain-containing protein [Nitrososphaerota archaeon]MDG7048355.1 DUF4382 domain-containing protein [Nitrososphaerota archaeon]MDG7048667.1 DUF4382 domain-containing protein [Nitrososphaerota archaeon]MDG7051515.1 DUF4382 domain-containing protein [Nitrososphaerota archaeon]